jgi:purine-binding chemotaxis protein CheW
MPTHKHAKHHPGKECVMPTHKHAKHHPGKECIMPTHKHAKHHPGKECVMPTHKHAKHHPGKECVMPTHKHAKHHPGKECVMPAHKHTQHHPAKILSAVQCMPTRKQYKNILHARAQLIATQSIETADQTEKKYYIRFCLGEKEQYGIDYTYIREVIDHAMITKLPCVPPYIVGVINRRGSLLAVIDLKKLFYNEMSNSSVIDSAKGLSIIIVKANHMTLGILTDWIEGNDRYDPNTLHAPLFSKHIAPSEFIIGLHEAKTAMINIEAIINSLH